MIRIELGLGVCKFVSVEFAFPWAEVPFEMIASFVGKNQREKSNGELLLFVHLNNKGQ